MKSLRFKSILFICLYLHLLFSQTLFASTASRYIVLKASQVSNSEFKAFVKNMSGAQSLSEYSLKVSPTSENQKNLFNALEQAQREFLEGSIEKAKLSFEAITKVSREADWSIEERQALFYSYMRLAQLSSDLKEKQTWLREAVRYDYELTPDKKLFAPPLIKEFAQVQKEEIFNSKNWDVTNLRENINWIKVNGKKYNTQFGGMIKLMNGPNRVTLISDKGFALVRVINAQQAMSLTVPNSYFDLGTCNQPRWPETNSMTSRLGIYYDEDCVYLFKNQQWQKSTRLAVITNKEIEETQRNETSMIKGEMPIKPIENNSENKSNKTLWIVGILAAGTIAAFALTQKESSKQDPVPTHQ